MKAIGYQTPGPASVLTEIDLLRPRATGHDLLVRVSAISVNPVDTKVRAGATPEPGQWKILGWDAVGVVEEVGESVTRFRPGDRVFYAGSITRPGTNAEFHLVDERITGHAPTSLSDTESAALPLTAITAWEMLFDRLDIRRPVPGAANVVLIIGGAGGVGSIGIQLVRALTDLTVITTASRPETRDWVRDLGAHHVIDHSQPLAAQVGALGIGAPGLVFSTTNTDQHLAGINDLIAPQGRFGLIDDPAALDILPFKRKAVSVHWELMFTRPIFQTADMGEQGELLDEVAKLADAGRIHSTVTEVLTPINAANLARAHTLIETGKARGKIVLEGW
ncbi:zinc-binding alcohol dehydrogenase family protein [Paracoccus sp. IB05]|uniref:zinc-binding alcohol dehydrogenase family protein n=1 Tax=Paracoccus sp. IB05 TaxID=2779367 RepID=UPI0018E726F5|nr:zinc-binding alcohol dehydrogenase family protein [Paracoccus sp. IB05]MBJ2153015.1 zinc-binding alcohol dehydrogenase family protein [Paracoccus sp. IB05]